MNPLRIALIALFLPALAFAKTQNAARPAAPPPATGFRAEFIAGVDDVEAKLLDLVEITPAESFSWRPAPGVRSISEVYMHIAASNYFRAAFAGVPAPKLADLETTVTKKADVAVELRKSFDHLRMVASRVEDFDKTVKMLGSTTSHRGVLLMILNHVHEHLGQSIAYARMQGVMPPWSTR
ncbi:MAG TPA: DinB family protein [Thermoanaerobaculia bacterium]|jgi:uncharacterized damage-inducible protein DinB